MSLAVLLLFVLLLFGLLAYCIREPAMALPVAIMTYSFKQVAALALPFLQTRDALFNYLVAIAILLAFIPRISASFRPGCRTREGRRAMLLVWLYLGLFWFSSAWSPYTGYDSWRFLPYFAIYFWILPMLLNEDSGVMVRVYQVGWVLTFLGALGLLLSPAFFIDPDIERMVVHFELGRFEEANPLVLADMGAYLILMSLFLYFQPGSPDKPRLARATRLVAVPAGFLLGLWLAFNTSRGETVTGLLAGFLFLALALGRTTARSLGWFLGLVGSFALVATLALTVFTPRGSTNKSSARYSHEALLEGSDQRQSLNTKNIRFAMASPMKVVFGIGARGGEKHIGTWPHNQFTQAFSETGMVGLVLFCACWILALRFGWRTLRLAQAARHLPTLHVTALLFSLLVYHMVVLSKKGSLSFVDTYMWLGLAIFGFDRAQTYLASELDPEADPALNGQGESMDYESSSSYDIEGEV